jgi:hypothetical protein
VIQQDWSLLPPSNQTKPNQTNKQWVPSTQMSSLQTAWAQGENKKSLLSIKKVFFRHAMP